MSTIRDRACIAQLDPVIGQLTENSSRTSWLHIEELLKSWLALDAIPQVFAVLSGYYDRAIDLSCAQFPDDSNVWLTEQIDEKALQQLMSQYPLDVAELMFRSLCKWAEREREKYNPSEIGEDGPFCYWHEEFKKTGPDHRGIEGVMASRLYLAAERVWLRGETSEITKLDALLRSDPWHLFRRMRWQLYADFPEHTMHSAREEVLRRIPFMGEIDYNRGSHDHEFAQLLTAHAKRHGAAFLSPEEVELFMNAVFAGPLGQDGKIIDGHRDVFRRKQLWPIASLLTGDALATYRAIISDDAKIEAGSYKPYQFGGGTGGQIVSIAPPEADNLDSMSDEQLWEFLNTWKPD